MRNALYILLVGVLVLSSTAVPVTATGEPTLPDEQVMLNCEEQTYQVNYSVATQLYSTNTDAIPDVVKPFVQSNSTEIVIENANQQYYTVTTDSAMDVTEVALGQTANEDVTVTLNRSTACRLYTAEDPVSTFQTVYANDAIEIEPTGTIKSAATTVVDGITNLLW